jgi:lipopolysaccharide/colanic/teichoic acid biosynthesis glycosyltransferase
LSAPLLCVLAALIKLDSPGPVLYRGLRFGLNGSAFECLKLRTMMASGRDTSAITRADDERITRLGSKLRRLRIDELPQLWNVVRGQMRLVGPRPEAPGLVDLRDRRWQHILSAKPGITGLAQLVFADEARLLATPDPETTYRLEIQPCKLSIDACYVTHRSLGLDLWILRRTLAAARGRPPSMDEVLRRARCGNPA